MPSDAYTIQVLSGKRWSIHSLKSSKNDAVAEARKILSSNFADEVRVLEGPEKNENVVFHEDGSNKKKSIGITMIADCAPWTQVDDLYKPENKLNLGRVIRSYLEDAVISVDELLHNPRNLEKLIDSPIMSSALDHLASLQAPKIQISPTAQREKLFGLLQQAQDKCRSSGWDEIKNGQLDAYLTEVGDLSDDKIRFRVMLGVTQITMRAPSWEGKFSVLFDLTGDKLEDLSPVAADFLDGTLSELLVFDSVTQELLGQQPDRYNAINVLARLCVGQYEAKKWDTVGLTHIATLMSKFPMGLCRQTLSRRVERMIRSRSKLTRGDMYDEKDAFKNLFPLFISKGGSILGGEAMADALTQCATRCFNRRHELDNPKEAISFILENLRAPILQLNYLLALAQTDFGRGCLDIVADYIPTFMDGPEHIHDIVHYKQPTRRKVKIITDIQKTALKVKLPNNAHKTLVAWLDELLYIFLDEERIVDKLDSPEEPLFVRATQLLQFCASGLLIEGKTLEWVRQRVQEHLRQPNFVERFTEGIDSQAKREKVITQLHLMLKKAGLQK